jgi:hypothetical protein
VVEVTVRTDPAIMRATRFYPDRLLIL